MSIAPMVLDAQSVIDDLLRQVHTLEDRERQHLERLAERDEQIEDLHTKLEAKDEIIDTMHARINAYEQERSYKRRMLANHDMEASHKLILDAVRDEILSRKTDPRSYCHIDFSEIAAKTGTSRFTVAKRVRELNEQFGAF